MRAADLEADAAARKWVPDLELFFGYRQVTADTATSVTETGHGFTLRIAVPITFFDHGQGDAALARAEEATARAERDALVQATRADERAADEALAALRSAKPDGSAARAANLVEQARRLYTAGEASLDDLLEAQALAEASALAAIDTEEARASARTLKARATGSLGNARLDVACSARGP
jgi:outer membrane protein TolC